MKVINLFAPPGTGKSTTGQILSGLLSLDNFKVEYVPEFAKFATWSNNTSALRDQIYMFAKQENRLEVLSRANLDYVVMDGPLPLALLFQPDSYYANYEPLVMEVFNSFDNVNFYLRKNENIPYKTSGRNETEQESMMLDKALRAIISRYQLTMREYPVDMALPFKLFEDITGRPAPSLQS